MKPETDVKSRMAVPASAATASFTPGPEKRSARGRVRSTIVKVIKTLVRGTRNMREAEKHVTKFGDPGSKS